MKKRIISFALSLIMLLGCGVLAFATSSFDRSVMRHGADIMVITEDDMEGEGSYAVKSIKDNALDTFSFDGGELEFYPMVYSDDSIDCYSLGFTYYGSSPIYINDIVFKIGDHRYVFTDVNSYSCQHSSSGLYKEREILIMDSYSMTMLSDIAEHRDETIKVRVKGKKQNLDFEPSDEMKNGMIHLYNLYVQAGGLSKSNLSTLSKDYSATLTIYDD